MLERSLAIYLAWQPPPMIERPYRAFGAACIRVYQSLLRRLVDRRCQFALGCSSYTLEQLRSNRPFAEVRTACITRYCECAHPLSWTRSGDIARFVTVLGRRLSQDEVSPHLRSVLSAKAD